MATRRLIIHADDLGLSPGVSQGILTAMAEGAVTSTSLLCNFPESRLALESALKAGRDVGWHLNLVQGRPVSPPKKIPSLVGRDDHFLPLKHLMLRSWAHRLHPDEIRTELAAQYRIFSESGAVPSHVDGHLHTHLLPQVREVLRDFISEKAIPFVRIPRESGGLGVPRWTARTFINLFLGSRSEDWRTSGARSLPFFGLALSGRPGDSQLWERELRRNPHPVAECMVHPGYFKSTDSALLGEMKQGREAELNWLTSPTLRKLLRDLDYQLVSFKDLKKTT